MLEILKTVSLRGLDARDYTVLVAPIEAGDVDSPTALRRAAAFELAVSVATIRLTMDLHCGRINPHEAHADLLANCEGFDPEKFVWHVSQSQSPMSEFDWLEPPSPGYQRTRLALQHYIPMLSKPEIILQPVGKAVNVGDSYAALVALRAVLVPDGDLRQSEIIGSSLIYDESTATAVKSFQHRHGLNPDGVLTAEPTGNCLCRSGTEWLSCSSRWNVGDGFRRRSLNPQSLSTSPNSNFALMTLT